MTAEFINRYLNKSPDQLEWEDLIQFLSEGIEENLNLEYKPRGLLVDAHGTPLKPRNPNDVTGFSQLAKLVSGFANSAGGLLVLGVKEKPEKHKGKIVKIRPGAISALPPTISRETIEHNLEAKIQVPIDDLTIVPLRRTQRSKAAVYLVDVAPSVRAPHRVNELHYYQRHNFSTVEMQHYQIADMFGRRLRPDLDLSLGEINRTVQGGGAGQKLQIVRVDLGIVNTGRAVAKYTLCLCSIITGGDSIHGTAGWAAHDGRKTAQYETKQDMVIYPHLPLNSTVIVHTKLNNEETSDNPVLLQFRLYAEDMQGKYIVMSIDPEKRTATEVARGTYR